MFSLCCSCALIPTCSRALALDLALGINEATEPGTRERCGSNIVHDRRYDWGRAWSGMYEAVKRSMGGESKRPSCLLRTEYTEYWMVLNLKSFFLFGCAVDRP